MSRALNRCLNLQDFEREAKKLLPKPLYGYISAYAEDGDTFKANLNAFKKYRFINQVLVDSSSRSTATELFGKTYAQPFGMAPVGLSALYTYRGDCVLARVAAERNIPMVLSSSSLIPMEQVIKENPDAWFQAYIPGNAEQLEALIQRVVRAQFRTLVITVDTPVNPNRENYLRAGFSSPLKLSAGLIAQGVLHPRWTLGTFARTLLAHGLPHFENNYAERGVPIIARNVERSFADRGKLTWHDIARVRAIWPHTLIIKGILNLNDVAKALDVGADGIILSNHGGRQLDCSVSPMDILPQVKQRYPDAIVMLDGGIRRGTDVLKAIALGAHFVFLGRPFAFAAAVGGQQGVLRLVDLLSAEIDRDLVMVGKTNLHELDEACLLDCA